MYFQYNTQTYIIMIDYLKNMRMSVTIIGVPDSCNIDIEHTTGS